MRNWKWIAKIWSMQSHQVGWRQTVQIVNICDLNLIELNRFKGNPRLTKERTEELGDRRRWTQSDTQRPYFSSATNAQSVKIRKKGRWMFVLKKLWIVSKREMEIFFFFFFQFELEWYNARSWWRISMYLCPFVELARLIRSGRQSGMAGKKLGQEENKKQGGSGRAERDSKKKETEERRKKNTDGLANERERSSLIQLAMTWNRPNSIAYRDTLWTFDGGIAQERSMYILHVHVEEGMRAGKMRTIDKLQIDLKNSGFHYSANRFFEKNRPCRRSSPHNLERLERFQSSRNEVKKKFFLKECCPFFSLFHVLFWFRFFTFVTTAFPTFKTFKCRLYYVLVEQ